MSARSAEVDDTMKCENVLTLSGMSLIRFGGRGGGGGLAFLLFGLLIVGVVVWALTRPSESAKN